MRHMTEQRLLNSATHYPVHHDNGMRDKRYSVRLEFCGHEVALYVLRFCGEWVGAFNSIPAATLRAVGHKAARLGNIVKAVES